MILKRFLTFLPGIAMIAAGIVALPSHADQYNADTPAVPSSPDSGTVSEKVTIKSHEGREGTFLTDEQGRPLYMYDKDEQGKSNCTGECLQKWPPLVVQNAQNVNTSGEVKKELIGTTQREDGKTQVTYKGMPLYRFQNDSRPFEAQGQSEQGWHLVKPDGSKLMGTQRQ